MYLKVIDTNDANRFKTYKKNYNWSFDTNENLDKKAHNQTLEMSI